MKILVNVYDILSYILFEEADDREMIDEYEAYQLYKKYNKTFKMNELMIEERNLLTDLKLKYSKKDFKAEKRNRWTEMLEILSDKKGEQQ